jgi:hypothetical protein
VLGAVEEQHELELHQRPQQRLEGRERGQAVREAADQEELLAVLCDERLDVGAQQLADGVGGETLARAVAASGAGIVVAVRCGDERGDVDVGEAVAVEDALDERLGARAGSADEEDERGLARVVPCAELGPVTTQLGRPSAVREHADLSCDCAVHRGGRERGVYESEASCCE